MSSNLPNSFKPINNVKRTYGQNEKKDKPSNLPSSFTPIKKKEKEESLLKSLARASFQIPIGIAEATTYGIATNLMNLIGTGDALDPEEIERLRAISEREGVPFDEQKYREAAYNASKYFPTPGNIADIVEEQTGLPTKAKNRLQEGLRFASSAGKATPGTLTQKLVGGAVGSATKETLQSAGVPKPLAEIAGFSVGPLTGAKTPSIEVSTKTKPSGIPQRQFENLKSSREVSANKINQINEKLQSDFKTASDKIISESPVGETAKNLATDPTFKQNARNLLDEAQKTADSLQGSTPSKLLKKEYSNISGKQIKGFSLNEYDKNYIKYMNEAIKEKIAKNLTPGQLVEQYRKNNRALSEYFEPGSSKALNRAKRDALLDQNIAISNLIEKTDPKLAKTFKDGNQLWTKIKDVEAIDEFVNEVFKDGMNYNKLHDFFDKTGYDRVFRKALGEKGYKEFEGLIQDMLQSEVPYKMLKVAKKNGFEDLWQTGTAFVLHPTIGKAKLTFDAGKKSMKFLMNSLLDKPQLTLNWKRGINDLKKGKFTEAEKEFNILKEEILPAEKNITEEMVSKGKTTNITPQNSSQSPAEDISSIGKMGNAMMENFYKGIFESLKKGKNTFAGVKDPLIEKAKPYFKRGEIKSWEDLQRLANDPNFKKS